MGRTQDITSPRDPDFLNRLIFSPTGERAGGVHRDSVLLLGGARSGKSSLAVDFAKRFGGPVTFIATAEPGDDEMAARIVDHQQQRPSEWTTVEEPVDIGTAIGEAPHGDCVVLDCLTLWVANLLGNGVTSTEIYERAADAVAVATTHRSPFITVSNEVGSGLVPTTNLGRVYRDVLGDVNQIWADATEHVYLLVAGRALELSRLTGSGGSEV